MRRPSMNLVLSAALLAALAVSACEGSNPLDPGADSGDAPAIAGTGGGTDGPGDDSGPGSDDSGPGSDDSGPGSDNSGPGSDNSGPGNGDDRPDDDGLPEDDEIHGFVGSVNLTGRTVTTTAGLRVRVASDGLIEGDGDLLTLGAVEAAVRAGVVVRMEADGTPGPDEFEASSVKFEVDD